MGMLANSKHELFSQALAQGKSQAEAYLEAGYKGDRTAACRLATNVNVQARVAELLGRITQGVVLTKQWVIERLIENATRAMQAEEMKDRDGNGLGEFKYEGSVANRALELLGKEVGMFVDRKEIGKPGDFDNLNADERKRLLDAIEAELAAGAGQADRAKPPGSTGPVSSLH